MELWPKTEGLRKLTLYSPKQTFKEKGMERNIAQNIRKNSKSLSTQRPTKSTARHGFKQTPDESWLGRPRLKVSAQLKAKEYPVELL